jgi:hypothetical protein
MNRRVASWRFICATLPPSTAKVSVQLNPRHVEEYPGIWPQVLRIAGAHLVSPALWSGLSRMNLDGRLPESACQYLQSVHGMNAVRNAALLQQLDGSILALNNLGVVPMLIKGASYIKSGIFEDPAARGRRRRLRIRAHLARREVSRLRVRSGQLSRGASRHAYRAGRRSGIEASGVHRTRD